MKISLDDTIKVDQALKAVNGAATSFTVTGAYSVRDLAAHTDNVLASAGITKAQSNGTIATFQPAAPYANAYRNSAISTLVSIKKSGAKWFLVAVKRTIVYPRNPDRFHVTAPPKAALAAAARVLRSIGRCDITVSAPETIMAAAA